MAEQHTRASALNRRADQLKRWNESELNKCSAHRNINLCKVKFDDGCVFLAACSSGDTEEVKFWLDRGADINTSNVDGLTALHQAVIDENLDMVEFLVENGADIEMQDNEGWTALHAAASCGFGDIVEFLIESGANILAVNNDGELPVDLAEEEDVQEKLEEEIDKKGYDVEQARTEEENKMLSDANQWLNSKVIKEKKHSKSGASALHVAAAKGYVKVINLLIQAGVNINDQDFDGWTPLHAAAHWGQKEAAELLVESMADMEARNKLGATCFDVADEDTLKWLEELKKKQASIKKDDKPAAPRIQAKVPPPLKRRSSVSRISVSKKDLLMHQDMSVERKQLEEKIHGKDETKEAVNNIDKVKEPEKIIKVKKYDESESSSSEDESSEDEKPKVETKANKPPPTPTTPSKKEAPSFTPKPLQKQDSEKKDEQPAWRQGLRKTGSSSAVPETKRNEEKLPRSASSPQMPSTEERKKPEDRLSRSSDADSSYTRRRWVDSEREKESKKVTEKEKDKERLTERDRSRLTDREKGNSDVKSITARRPQYMTPTTEDTESETQRRSRARRERASRRSTQGVTQEDLESAEILVGQPDKGDNKKEETKETTGYTRRSRRTDDNEVSTTRPSSGYSSRSSTSTTTSSYSRPSSTSSYSRPSSTSYSSSTRPSSTSSYRPSSSYTPSSSYRRY